MTTPKGEGSVLRPPSKPEEESDEGIESIEAEVLSRYARGAQAVEAELCCPTSYDPADLDHLPREIVEKDYGCGDPSRFVRAGETVLDLGSGSGKACYILAKRVGPRGRVVGVDFNDAMLALARRYRGEVAEKLGYANVSFRKGRIQDLGLDLELAQRRLDERPVKSIEELAEFEAHCRALREREPLVGDDSVDVVVSNCVLNLVSTHEKRQLFGEIFRVLKRGGRAVISDIVCDEDPTPAILDDPPLWSGCISGAFREDRFPAMFEEAGFYGVEILARGDRPWRVIDGVEFRSMTVRAFKGKEGPCLERNQAVIYTGPWKQVRDDDGHVLRRGERMAVCDKTFRIMTDAAGPYAASVVAVPPREEVPADQAKQFDCKGTAVRSPRQSKGLDYRETAASDGGACGDDGGCC